MRSGTRAVLRAAAVGAFLLQCVLLYWPNPEAPQTDLPLDKVVHFAMFAGVALLARWSGLATPWVVGILLAQAVGSEVLQFLLLPQRSGDVADLAFDVAGIAVGTWAGALAGARLSGEGADVATNRPRADTHSGMLDQ